jgi:hypothetical protein
MKWLLCVFLVAVPLLAECDDRWTTRDSSGRTIDTRGRDGNREVIRDEAGRTVATKYYDRGSEEFRDSSGRSIWKRTR